MMEGFGSVQIIMDPDPGGPKTYGSYVSGSGTLVIMFRLKFAKARLM
jgi:hypothetical protein